jgi:hypothetical protein
MAPGRPRWRRYAIRSTLGSPHEEAAFADIQRFYDVAVCLRGTAKFANCQRPDLAAWDVRGVALRARNWSTGAASLAREPRPDRPTPTLKFARTMRTQPGTLEGPGDASLGHGAHRCCGGRGLRSHPCTAGCTFWAPVLQLLHNP